MASGGSWLGASWRLTGCGPGERADERVERQTPGTYSDVESKWKCASCFALFLLTENSRGRLDFPYDRSLRDPPVVRILCTGGSSDGLGWRAYMRLRFAFALCLFPWFYLTGDTFARNLTFEDRVKAQEAIERVYYSHQIGATKPFEEAVPRWVLEQKVTTYLKESVALVEFWHTPVTAEMLRGEMERMAR